MNSNLDPESVQVVFIAIQSIFTVVLVIVTIFYVRYTRKIVEESEKTRKNILELEMERRTMEREKEEKKKMAIRKLICGELADYDAFIFQIEGNITKFKEGEIEELPLLKFPDPFLYHIIDCLLLLYRSEINTIIYAYHDLKQIEKLHEKIQIKSTAENISYKDLEKDIGLLYGEIQGFSEWSAKLQDEYNKLFKGKIEEFKLDKTRHIDVV